MHPAAPALRLDVADDFMHPIEEAENFNESMYFNVFDHRRRIGGWFRIGNRPNEGHAEVSCCVYLDNGQVGFMYQRAKIEGNDCFNAGGLSFQIEEPMRRHQVRYKGKLCVLDDPQQMLNPGLAFKQNPTRDCEVMLNYRAIGPAFGGESVNADGSPLNSEGKQGFARAHYEQHSAVVGEIIIGGRSYTVSGLGLRDHSWGPRYWQNIYWYRWLPLCFNNELAMMLSVVARKSDPDSEIVSSLNNSASSRLTSVIDPKQQQKPAAVPVEETVWGVVLNRDFHNQPRIDHIVHSKLKSNYDGSTQQLQSLRASITTESGKHYELVGKVVTTLPLRNRRTAENGETLHTRITESMVEFRCGDLVGYGMAEYLDQIIDDQPVGLPR